MPRSVFVHIVTFNSAQFIEQCIASVLAQKDIALVLHLTDNASSDETVEIIEKFNFEPSQVRFNNVNVGFSDGHNLGVHRFLESNADFFFVLNPDVVLEERALAYLVAGFDQDKVGSTCPKLLRADDSLTPVIPSRLDAAGMSFDSTLRHFDRGSQEIDTGQFDCDGEVFGGSGAALLLSRRCIIDVAWPARNSGGVELFDSNFFAYREDAELAWRMQRLGWKARYVAKAVGYHRRLVLPERRASLPSEINRFSVRNRFLMQILHFNLEDLSHCLIPGIVVRNLIVIFGVFITEWSSLPAFIDIFKLRKKYLGRRKELTSRAVCHGQDIAQWFM